MSSIITITRLLNETRCYEEIRKLRWSDKVTCPYCQSTLIVKKGYHTKQKARQRYQCTACAKRFDDLTETVFAGHHQPLTVWILCLYLMGLNLSNAQISKELDLNQSDTHEMCKMLREMIDKKKSSHSKR